ncbi:MAPEG family protein [Pseudoalteromonas sp. DL2-H2.2]|uniref:MAPEG family protein n=1 Tax=Pseudoalteromonas sp. DL2-H2.2 TaxID=2908889 RepID=UPI001F2CD61F|nr:MAPEG family protein [Pseudoalteromonas sp. DL2-H2.2]MCF2909137.1 MAPEG family protein [Pseudoalteromonas sp. DL2-H2.2]
MWIHIPIFFLVLLYTFLWLTTAGLRIRAVYQRKISLADIRFVSKESFPERIRLLTNSYDNQFQLPLLFICLLLLLHIQAAESQLWYMFSTVFVTARYWHCYEHILGNNLKMRTLAFALSSLTLYAAWFTLLWQSF